MAYTTIAMKHAQTGEVRQAPIGFSWTYMFFGPFVCLFRKHYEGHTGFWLGFLYPFLSGGVFYVVMWFIYNKKHFFYLRDIGFEPVGNLSTLKISDKIEFGLSIEDNN